ncbi:DUF7716 domain-containing protein [Rubinisphaera italica]|nr:hypothetical protein [Rubinisphaera italica]
MDEIMRLSDVLDVAGEFQWSDALYLPINTAFTLNTPAIVYDPDDVVDDGQETPVFPSENGMVYVLGINTVQEILSNLNQQKPECTADDKLKALNHYVLNDAFICLN